MFKNLLIKWKLATLVAVMMVALLVVGISGYTGIATVGNAVNEIGVVRLPSIQGLMMISEGQTAVAAATLTAAMYENNYQAQDKFAEALQLRTKAWNNIEAGRKLYEPLPQTAEEAVLWKRFQGEWTAWKADDDKVRAILRQLADNRDEPRQKELFAAFYKQYQDSRSLFGKAEGTLNEIIKLNNGVADASVKDGSAAVIRSESLMVILGLLASALGIGCAAYITRAITQPINSAVKVAQTVASGDLTSQIEVHTTEETGQLLQALKDMNASLLSIVGEVRSGTDTIATASTRNRQRQPGPVVAHGRAGQFAGRNGVVDGRADHHREAECRQCAPGQPAGGVGVAAWPSRAATWWRRWWSTMDSINDSSRKIVDIIGVIDGIAFQTNILALERGRGSGARGRAGTRLCRRGLRSAQPGAALGRRREGNQDPDRRLGRAGRRGQQAGGRGGQHDGRNRRQRAARDATSWRKSRLASSEQSVGHRPDQPGHRPDGPGDAAKRGPGGRGGRRRRIAAGAGGPAGPGGQRLQARWRPGACRAGKRERKAGRAARRGGQRGAEASGIAACAASRCGPPGLARRALPAPERAARRRVGSVLID